MFKLCETNAKYENQFYLFFLSVFLNILALTQLFHSYFYLKSIPHKHINPSSKNLYANIQAAQNHVEDAIINTHHQIFERF